VKDQIIVHLVLTTMDIFPKSHL